MYIDAFLIVLIFLPRPPISFSNWLLNDSTEVVQDRQSKIVLCFEMVVVLLYVLKTLLYL